MLSWSWWLAYYYYLTASFVCRATDVLRSAVCLSCQSCVCLSACVEATPHLCSWFARASAWLLYMVGQNERRQRNVSSKHSDQIQQFVAYVFKSVFTTSVKIGVTHEIHYTLDSLFIYTYSPVFWRGFLVDFVDFSFLMLFKWFK